MKHTDTLCKVTQLIPVHYCISLNLLHWQVLFAAVGANGSIGNAISKAPSIFAFAFAFAQREAPDTAWIRGVGCSRLCERARPAPGWPPG